MNPETKSPKQEVLMMISQRRFIPEVLKTQEAISLQTAVQNGGGYGNDKLRKYMDAGIDERCPHCRQHGHSKAHHN